MKTWPHPSIPDWDGSIAGARALQVELARGVILEDAPSALAPRRIAGFDVGFEDDNRTTRAAAVLLDAASLEPVAEVVARIPTSMPYIPGLLSFRELPALFEALRQLPETPDLVFVDGHGIAHPRRLGIAAHFGVASGLPTLGVAKKILVGRHVPLGETPGDAVELVDGTDWIGWLLRSKARCRPLIVSPGHRVSPQGALRHVRAALRGYRLPEPTRLADRIASRRDRRRMSTA
ncbi:deoxyribonuclease V [Coralloluteibacterium stylophorae]|uniref:Endonuclease V n=1 Tax=Coralloluteibacterium stylophorae TaxID=1776034 RepID=A0A8J7VTB9_9GAMM|nr:deoxyribonuclease V [Coralloluteibacterium stylophorae]MBS7458652.1 deoxyribonuclease V [Coralloluteibacterium stylophorae]